MTSIGLEMAVADIRTDNWRTVLDQMGEKFQMRKAMYRQAAALYFKLDLMAHFLPLMIIQLAIAILSGLAQVPVSFMYKFIIDIMYIIPVL